ncbi:hypothetical protein BU056_12605, partial [Staphylococcus succinus]
MIYTESNFNFEDVNENISHLKKGDIVSLINRYYQGENINSLISEYKINTISSRLVLSFPLVYTDLTCKYCNNIMYKKLVGRTAKTKSDIICINCKHVAFIDCNCENCENKRIENIKKINAKKKEIISNSTYPNKISENNLSQLDRFYLSLLIRCGLDENMTHIKPLNDISTKVAPTIDKAHKTYEYLIANNIIIPDFSKSDSKYFNFDFENELIKSYYPDYIYFVYY